MTTSSDEHSAMAPDGRTDSIATLPNLISLARIALAVWFPLAPESLRLTIVVVAGLSDAVDGYIARRFRVSSWQGGLLDAAADKLFTLSALSSLTYYGVIPLWQLPLLLTRDIAVAGMCSVVVLRRRFGDFRRMQSRLAGKATTLLLFALMTALLLPLPELIVGLTGLSMAASFAAAVDYGQTYSGYADES